MSRPTAFSAEQQADLYELLCERYERSNSDAVAFKKTPTVARMDGGGITRSELPPEYQADELSAPTGSDVDNLHPFYPLGLLGVHL
jgi:hypothetical protein